MRTIVDYPRNEAGLVDKFIGTAYDTVKYVADNMVTLTKLYDFLGSNGMLLTVSTEDELKALAAGSKYARVYNSELGVDYSYKDYLFVEGDFTGIPSNTMGSLGSWLELASSSSGSGNGNLAYSWVYNNGSAVGGETTITLPELTTSVLEIHIDSAYQALGYGFEFDAATNTLTLAEPLEEGQLVAVTYLKSGEVSRAVQEVARANNIPDSQVILSTDTFSTLGNKTIIFDTVAQKFWKLPSGIPTTAKIYGVSGTTLVYSPGQVSVTLLPVYIGDVLQTSSGAALVGTFSGLTVQAELDKLVNPEGATLYPSLQMARWRDEGDVRGWGVKVDGVTDDSDALISALNSGLSLLKIPAGRCIVKKSINIPPGVSLIGAGIDYWDTYRPAPDRLLKSWGKGTHLVFTGSGAKSKTFLNLSNERPVKTVNGVVCKFTPFTNEDSVGTLPATPKGLSVAVSAVHASQIRNLRIMVSKSGIDGYNDAGSNTLGDDWDIGLHVYDSSDAVIDNVQVVGYWRVKGLLLTENDGSLTVKGNSEKTHFNNVYVQSGIAVRNSPQIDVISNTTDSVTFAHRASLRITAGNTFVIAGSADVRTFTGATFDGTNVTLTGVTPAIPGTIGVIRYQSIGNNFSGTVFENTVATTLDHTSGQPAETFGLPTSFALEVDGYPVRNLRFDKFKAQTTYDHGNTLWGDCRDVKLTSSEFENGCMVAYSLAQSQGYTGNMRFFASDLQSNVDTSGFTPRDAFVDNRQIKTDFTDGSFILKNWRATNTRFQWSTGQDALLFREASTETSIGGLYGYTLDGSRWLTVDGPTKDITIATRNGSFNNSADNSSVINWFGTSGNVSFKGVIAPMVDNSKSIGSASSRWAQIYAATGTINTSDGRCKTKITELEEAERKVAQKLKALIRRFRFIAAMDEKGDNARWHFGVIAQDVEKAFTSEGLDAHDYGLFCHDSWETEYEPVMATKTVVDEDTGIETEVLYDTGEKKVRIEAGDRYGIRYEELLCFIIAAL